MTGTQEANVDQICRESLDPKRRAGQAFGAGNYTAIRTRGGFILSYVLLQESTLGWTLLRHLGTVGRQEDDCICGAR